MGSSRERFKNNIPGLNYIADNGNISFNGMRVTSIL